MASKCVDSDIITLESITISCILLPKTHLFIKEYGLNWTFESQGSFSSNSLKWRMLLYTKTKMVSECVEYVSDHKRIIFQIDFDYFRLINRKCASNYSDDQSLFFVWLPITNGDVSKPWTYWCYFVSWTGASREWFWVQLWVGNL
jgi:hypothetical protein